MPRPPRRQFPGAIYHVVTRGDGRCALFPDDGHYQRLSQGLADEVQRSGWQVLACCWMRNHLHVLLRTPRGQSLPRHAALVERLRGVDLEQIFQVVAMANPAAPEAYVGFRSAAVGREMAALLCRRLGRG